MKPKSFCPAVGVAELMQASRTPRPEGALKLYGTDKPTQCNPTGPSRQRGLKLAMAIDYTSVPATTLQPRRQTRARRALKLGVTLLEFIDGVRPGGAP